MKIPFRASPVFAPLVAIMLLIPCPAVSAQPAPESNKQSVDSSRSRESAKQFPTDYDGKILKEIEKSSDGSFVWPLETLTHLDSVTATKLTGRVPFVWLQLKLEDDDNVKGARVTYCSEPQKGLEQRALDVVRNKKFRPRIERERWRWLWHKVQFVQFGDHAGLASFPPDVTDTNTAGIVAPEFLYWAQPEYPRIAKQRALTGTVWVEALVDKSGSVTKVRVLLSSGIPELDQAALNSGPKNRFKPALKNGEPVEAWVHYKIDFKLNE